MSSFTKSFGEFLIRTAGFLAAVVAIGLTVGLVWKFTGGQDHVAIGVALLSVFISSVGLLLARSAWRRAAYPEFLLGCTMWVAGAAFLGFNELGYWAASYEGRHETYTQARKDEQRKEGLKDRAWEALTTGAVPVSSAQLTAQIKAKRFDPVYDRSIQCTDATAASSRAFCGELAMLEAKLAGAVQREKFESQVVTNGTLAEAAKSDHADRMNVFANAEWLSRKFGGTEREWADYILLTGLAVLMLVRDMGFLVAFPLGRREKAAVASKAVPSVTVATYAPRGPVGFSDGPLAAIGKLGCNLDRPATQLSTDELRAILTQAEHPGAYGLEAVTDPKPDGGGSAVTAPKPEQEQRPAVAKPTLIVSNEPRNQKGRRKPKVNKHDKVGRVVDWLSETTTQDQIASTLSEPAYENYEKWCHAQCLYTVPWRQFTKKVKTTLRLKKKRDAKTGQQILPIRLSDPAQWQSQKRMVA